MQSDDRGQALVEFSIVIVLFVMLLSGLVDLSRVAATWVVMSNAGREGARVGALGHSDAEIISTIESAANTLDLSRLEIDVQPSATSRVRGVPLEVQLSYTLDLIMPLTAIALPNPMPIQISTVMRVE